MPDENEYPTDEEIEKLKTMANDIHGFEKLIDFLRTIWWMPDWGFIYKPGKNVIDKDCMHLELHTGGWSGNEDIIAALDHTWFWRFCFEGHRRGGHYYFELPKKGEANGSKDV